MAEGITKDLVKKEMIFYSCIFCMSLDTSLCSALAAESSVLALWPTRLPIQWVPGDKVAGA